MTIRSTTCRVFLVGDHPDLRSPLRALATRIHEVEALSPEVVLLDPTTGASDIEGKACDRDFREGDLLILLSRGETDPLSERFAQSTTERAIARRLIVLPVLPQGHADYRRSPWRKALARSVTCAHVDFAADEDVLPRIILGELQTRFLLGCGQTDLRGLPVAEDGGAWTETCAHGSSAMQPHLARAMKALEGRLFDAAIDCLRQAQVADATDAIPCYWSARLRLATNRSDELNEALVEATRGARLARLAETDSDLERASWMLAVRAATALGEEAAAMEYLSEAMTGTLSATDWLEVARRHADTRRYDRTLAALEEAFYLDASTLSQAGSAPEFALLAHDLGRLEQDLRERLRFQIRPLLESEAVILAHNTPDDAEQSRSAHEHAQTAVSADQEIAALVEIGQRSAVRQVELLNGWAAQLVADAHRHQALKSSLEQFPPADQEPALTGFGAWLHHWWAPYRHQWDLLVDTFRSQMQTRHTLAERTAAMERTLRDQVAVFLQTVEQFERAALADPLLAPACRRSDATESDLIIFPSTDADPVELERDSEIVPDLLIPYTPAKVAAEPGARLYRLEAHLDTLAGSRAGVYFQRAKEEATRAG